ncbi:hypothetical protein COLO4_20304 [Corchorus olitorius]|uniref:Uncharacterized protein n=1 Tax=Corchorus olitorius TaxID=93759 RepID=A0A1R3J0H5_9ROSI|nr:hypothetical protein COLO4_20304 [Corchorus olitorius]
MSKHVNEGHLGCDHLGFTAVGCDSRCLLGLEEVLIQMILGFTAVGCGSMYCFLDCGGFHLVLCIRHDWHGKTKSISVHKYVSAS